MKEKDARGCGGEKTQAEEESEKPEVKETIERSEKRDKRAEEMRNGGEREEFG